MCLIGSWGHEPRPRTKTTNQDHELRPRTKTTNQDDESRPQTKTTNQNHEPKPRTKTTSESGPFGGYVHVSESYFAMNTISLVVPKASVGVGLREKLGGK